MRLVVAGLAAFSLLVAPAPGVAAPEGQLTWAVHISLAPTWFDPAETYYGSLTTGVGWIVPKRYTQQVGDGSFGNTATRLETFVASGGPYVYGAYPDIDGLFREQAGELDRKRREAILHRIQQLIHDKAMVAPIWELGFIHAQGPRVAEAGLGLITGYAFSTPYEEVKLRGK
jgi:hypothetical protein